MCVCLSENVCVCVFSEPTQSMLQLITDNKLLFVFLVRKMQLWFMTMPHALE